MSLLVTSCFVAGSTNFTCQSYENDRSCKVSRSVAVCKLRNISHLRDLLGKGINATSLDVSNNSLGFLPENSFNYLHGLRRLSLAFNNIQVLMYDVFDGLDSLEIMNLSYNPLKYFSGDVKDVLPSLTLLDLTGVKNWKPDKQLTNLPLLKKIFGFSLGNGCSNCSLHLPDIMTNLSFIYKYKSGNCHVIHFNLSGVLEKLTKLESDSRFQLSCDFPLKCFQEHLDFSKISKVHNLCWDDSLAAANVVGVLGLLGALINLIVVFNIILSKELRKNSSMLFVCNMGVSDFLLSVFSLFLLVYFSSYSYDDLYRFTRATNWKIGFLWMMGQCGSIITSFYLTLERYLVIVYAMNPNIRIGNKCAYLLILICWLVAVVLTVYAMYFQFYAQSIFCIPIRVNSSVLNSHIFIYSIVIGVISLALYIASLILYVRIYYSVKQSANLVGVKRESKVARRIALLVFSNIFFYCFPLVITGSLAVAIPGSMTTTYQVILVLSLTLNSFLNPLLHGFRNDRFQNVFKNRVQPYLLSFTNIVANNVTKQKNSNQ